MIVARHAISEGFGLGAWLGRSHDGGGASDGEEVYAARVRVRTVVATGAVRVVVLSRGGQQVYRSRSLSFQLMGVSGLVWSGHEPPSVFCWATGLEWAAGGWSWCYRCVGI